MLFPMASTMSSRTRSIPVACTLSRSASPIAGFRDAQTAAGERSSPLSRLRFRAVVALASTLS